MIVAVNAILGHIVRRDVDKWPGYTPIVSALVIGLGTHAVTGHRRPIAHEPSHVELYQALSSSAALSITADTGTMLAWQRVDVMSAPTRLLTNLGVSALVLR